MNPEIITLYGAPGTGKTSWLEKRIAKRIVHDDVKPYEIGAFMFTKSDARDLRTRVAKRAGVDERQLDGIRTIHSKCRALVAEEFGRARLVTARDQEEFCDLYHFAKPTEPPPIDEEADWVPRQYRNFPDYWAAWNQMVAQFPGLKAEEAGAKLRLPGYFDLNDFFRFCEQWPEFKREEGLVDFADMPLLAVQEGLQAGYAHLFLDEYQDTFPLLRQVVNMWAARASEVVFAGDPMQSIYTYMGCDPELFHTQGGRNVVRRVTHRLPESIWEIGKALLQDHPQFFPPDCPIQEVKARRAGGVVKTGALSGLEDLVRGFELAREPTFILARTHHQVRKLAHRLAQEGISYTSLGEEKYGWPDEAMHLLNILLRLHSESTLTRAQVVALLKLTPQSFQGITPPARSFLLDREDVPWWKLERYLVSGLNLTGAWTSAFAGLSKTAQTAVLARNEKFQLGVGAAPFRMIKIGTGHAAKGREATNVVAYDRISPRMHSQINADAAVHAQEARVWYVMVTRAKERLYVLSDQDGPRYPIPTP